MPYCELVTGLQVILISKFKPIASDFEAEFKNALIDHELRVVIEEKTKVVKEALVCAALREAWSEPVDAK